LGLGQGALGLVQVQLADLSGVDPLADLGANRRTLEQGEPSHEAARKAMDEVTGPVIAVALVLCAVFVPCAFLGGVTGQFFRQFAVAIAVSTVISAFNSLTLSPALAALLLKPRDARPDLVTRLINLVLGWFFRLFNK